MSAGPVAAGPVAAGPVAAGEERSAGPVAAGVWASVALVYGVLPVRSYLLASCL